MPLLQEQVLSQLGADIGDAALAELLALFIAELAELGEKLRFALEIRSVPDVIDVSHILKNSAALYGATDLADQSRILHDELIINGVLMHDAVTCLHNLLSETLVVYRRRYPSSKARKGDHK